MTPQKLPNLSNYEIYPNGTVFSLTSNKQMRFFVGSHGYKGCTLINDDGKRVYPLLHRLIAEAFLEKKADKKEVNHRDGNKFNNVVENLEWCTPYENRKHAQELGLRKYKTGTKHLRSKINLNELREIVLLLDKGEMLQYEIAKKFGVGRGIISTIRKGATYKEEAAAIRKALSEKSS